MVIAATIGLVLLNRFLGRPTFRRVVLGLSIGVFFILLMSVESLLGGVEQTHGMSWGKDKKMFASLYERLAHIPEVSILIFIGLMSSLSLFLFSQKKFAKHNIDEPSPQQRAFYEVRIITSSFLLIFCASIAYATYQGYLFLPRYILPMIPFATISILLVVKVLNLQTTFKVLFLALCYINVYNYNGVLYGYARSFGITERSHAYKEYSQGHQALIDEISQLPNDRPIFVSRGIDYLISHPMMGRIEQSKPNIYGIYKPEYSSLEEHDFPREFYLVLSTQSTIHGGKRIEKLIKEMRKSEHREVEELYNRKFAGIDMGIYHVRTKNER